MPQSDSSFNFTGMTIEVIFYLIIIIGLFLVIIKFLAKKNRSWLHGRAATTLGGITLGQNKSIQIVKIGHVIYLVGVGENVQIIDKIEQPEEVAYILDTYTSTSNNSPSGSNLLDKWLNRMKKNPQIEEDTAASFQQVFQQKLQNVSNRKKWVNDLLQENKNIDERSNDQ